MNISDEDLLRRAVAGVVPDGRGKRARWVAIMDRFALGSTFAHELCQRFGYDPDEMVKHQ